MIPLEIKLIYVIALGGTILFMAWDLLRFWRFHNKRKRSEKLVKTESPS